MLDSSNDTVAILYDIENAPIEMLQYTIDKAQRYQPCRMIVVSDWEAHPEQKRWDRLMEYPDFTFRQISRTFYGKNSLDSALYDSAQILYQEGVRKYFIITTDSDFVRIAESLNAEDPISSELEQSRRAKICAMRTMNSLSIHQNIRKINV